MHKRTRLLLRKAGLAVLTTLIFYYTFVFINLGTIWVLDEGVLIELLLVFLFLLFTFWSHGLISRAFSKEPLVSLPPILKALAEGGTVVAVSLLLNVTIVMSLTFVMLPEADIIPLRVRMAMVVGAIISLFFYYFVERERERKQLQEEFLRAEQLQKENFKAQLNSLKNQVNPHFLFNSLNVLTSLVYKDQDQAVSFIGQLSEVYRGILDNHDRMLVPLQTELDLANAYIYLMKTRFGDSVHFNIHVPANKLQCEVPPSSLQMLIENSIKHNGSTKQKKLSICIYTEGDQLIVSNNLQPRLEEVKSTKVGLQNIRNRYSYITDQQVVVEQTAEAFTVKLPLLHVQTVV